MVHYYLINEKLRKNKVLLSDIMDEKDCCLLMLIEIEEVLKNLKIVRQKQLKDLEDTNEKIKNEFSKKDELEKKLRNLDLRLKEKKEIIENTTVIVEIAVDDNGNFNLRNGIVDTNRDIIMNLLKIIRDRTKIRNVYCSNVIGMGKIFYIWSKRPIFRSVINYICVCVCLHMLCNILFIEKQAKSFSADTSGSVVLSQNSCTFNAMDRWRLVFVDYPMVEGIHKIVFKIMKFQSDGAMFGIYPLHRKNSGSETCIGIGAAPGSCGIHIYGNNLRLYYYASKSTPNLYSSFPFQLNLMPPYTKSFFLLMGKY